MLYRVRNVNNAFGVDVDYEYDEAGNVTKITYLETGKDVIYTYDQLNRLEKVTNWLGDVTTYFYDVAEEKGSDPEKG